MRLAPVIVCLLAFMGCKPSPNYNPFDDQFNVSVRDIMSDGCDTISAGCGYFNLQVPAGRFRPYYQIFAGDFYEVVAKGFEYVEDTIIIRVQEDPFHEKLSDSLQQFHFDPERFNKEIAKFDYQILRKSGNRISIINSNLKDTVELTLDLYSMDNDSSYKWAIKYWKPMK